MLVVGTHWPPTLSHRAGLGVALGLGGGWGPSGLSAGMLSSLDVMASNSSSAASAQVAVAIALQSVNT